MILSLVKLFWLSAYLATPSYIPIMVCSLASYKKRTTYIRLLGYFGFAGICFSIAQITATSAIVNPIGNVWTLFELLLFSALYFTVTHDKIFRILIIFLGVAYIVFYGIVFGFFSTYSFSSIRTGRDVILILYALLYFFYLLKKLPEEDLLKFPMLWINASVIFYFSGTFILSFFRDYIVIVLKDDVSGFWAFRNFFRMAFCLVLSYAAWLDWRSIRLKKITIHP